MNYIHNPYPYPAHVPMDHQSVAFDPAMMHPSMVHQMDGYVYQHPHFDMVDFYHQPIMDYDEYAENLSRPRLTKDQVETLEAQFQAHPKPSSNVKRQLAAQTNLSLPRVANWFQNRRAKAKQQKRQEEFERMQKAKAEAEEVARCKTEGIEQSSDSSENNRTPPEESDKSSTPRPSTSVTVSAGSNTAKAEANASARSKHKKTRSESAREATFASLQRALNAAVAAREHDGPQTDSHDTDSSVSPTTTAASYPPHSNASDAYDDSHSGQNTINTSFTEWEGAKPAVPWTSSHSPQEPFGYTFSAAQAMDNARQQDARHDNVQYSPGGTQWPGQVPTSATVSLPGHRAVSDTEASYTALQYTLQSDVPDDLRRGSSDDITDTLEGIGIDATGTAQSLSHLAHQADRISWKEAGKELDLAARRKRPRPAAIGTSKSSSLLAAPSSMSPTTRMPAMGAGHGVRQSKSAQSLNSRYAGVRKASAAQRSPLNFSTFAEAGALNSAKAELSTMLKPTVSTSLAPPTPLTPEDLQHLLPTSPTDGYCLSANPTVQFFPTTQPMQINIASPPATPMTPADMMSSYQYQNVPPPLSAPAHYTSFPEYSTCDTVPLTAKSWTGAPSLSSPEMSFHASCQMSQQADTASMSYDSSVEQSGQMVDSGSMSGSPTLVYPASDAELSASVGSLVGDRRSSQFVMHEFPEQQKAHRFVARQLPSHGPKHYTFVDQPDVK